MIDIYKIIEKYSPNDDIFSEEDEKVTRLKKIIFGLDEVQKRIILMYCELGSLRAVAKECGVSATAIYYVIKEIKRKILELYDNS